MRKVKYEEMLLHEFEAALEAKPIAYIPCGLLEWHSTHLPLGIDGLKIEEMSCRIAEKFGGIVLPPFYVGAPGYTAFQGTITYRPETVCQVFKETFSQLIKVGFRVIVAIGGHYGEPQETSLKKAANEIMDTHDVNIWVLNEADVVNDIGIHGDHAGPWETSLGLEFCENLVDLDRFTPGEQNIKRYPIEPNDNLYEFEYKEKPYYLNDGLNNLDKTEIHRQLEIVIDQIGQRAEELLYKEEV